MNTPTLKIDKKDSNNTISLSENIQLLVNLIKDDIKNSFSRPPKPNQWVSKTRGNVYQRLGGVITAEEHDRIVRSEFPSNK